MYINWIVPHEVKGAELIAGNKVDKKNGEAI